MDHNMECLSGFFNHLLNMVILACRNHLKRKIVVDYLISYYRLSREFIRQNPYNLPKPISTSTQFQRPVGTTSHDIKKAGFVYQPPAFF
jgi:hypothetical protein